MVMRIDEQVAEVETETDACIAALRRKLQGFRFQRLGNRQFEDVGRVYERRGSPAAQLFVQSKLRESRQQERQDYERLLDLVRVVSESKLDIHLKGFILRKLPSILPEHFR
jgi:hypothetical protein